ncbi:Stf0 family sulfotransferase [Gymnodinialimonas sp. 2305UL16-5]|uniref:Stf0 family sulfotransferase n=1 Tax=Gymnodinialimonas mytili TaxID=3126503 RepID=UPI00309F91A6
MDMVEAYMICTAPRSGSTLLCRMLGDTGVAGQPQSYFFEQTPAEWASKHGGGPVGDPPSRTDLARVFAAIRDTGRGSTDLFAVRMQAPNLPGFRAGLAQFLPDLAGDVARINRVFGAMRYVHLHRADKVAQAVSYLRAQQSGLWHRHADGSELERLSPPARPLYDAEAIAERVAMFEAYDAAWETWFAAEGVNPLRLDYGALSHDPGGTLGQVLAYLGLDPDLAQGIAPSVKRLADAESAEWIARFRGTA